MTGRKVPVTLPSGAKGEGVEIQVSESTERWSDFTFDDGTLIRAKIMVTSAVRVDGEFDQNGNPVYIMNVGPVFSIVHVPEQYRKKVS